MSRVQYFPEALLAFTRGSISHPMRQVTRNTILHKCCCCRLASVLSMSSSKTSHRLVHLHTSSRKSSRFRKMFISKSSLEKSSMRFCFWSKKEGMNLQTQMIRDCLKFFEVIYKRNKTNNEYLKTSSCN